jgi:uncharacterized protein YndB with AHSA1/START domain
MNKQSLGLELNLPSDREIRMTRHFPAPPDLVFDAHVDCDHLKRWWGPQRYDLTVCELDLRVGGKWRFVQRGEDGQEFGFRGEFRSIERPKLLAYTFEFEDMPGHICLETLTFDEADGGTLLTDLTLFDSKEDRDGMLQSGMEEGAAESLDRLAELLASGR